MSYNEGLILTGFIVMGCGEGKHSFAFGVFLCVIGLVSYGIEVFSNRKPSA